MGVLKILTAPIWIPLFLLWSILAFIGKSLWFILTFSLKVTILVLAIFGLIVLLWWW